MKENTKNISLYHFTNAYHIKDIFKYGIIFGDVMTSHFSGFNAPNLTEEDRYHVPSGSSKDVINKGWYRLSIRLSKNDKKLLNYAEFDKKYANSINHKFFNNDSDGYLEKQWIYLGHIKQTKFIDVHRWDFHNKKWVSTNEVEITKHLKLNPIPENQNLSMIRVCGYVFNDKTGMVKNYYKNNDGLDQFGNFYKYSDYVVQTLMKKSKRNKKHTARLKEYRMSISRILNYEELVNFVIKKYEHLAPALMKLS